MFIPLFWSCNIFVQFLLGFSESVLNKFVTMPFVQVCWFCEKKLQLCFFCLKAIFVGRSRQNCKCTEIARKKLKKTCVRCAMKNCVCLVPVKLAKTLHKSYIVDKRLLLLDFSLIFWCSDPWSTVDRFAKLCKKLSSVHAIGVCKCTFSLSVPYESSFLTGSKSFSHLILFWGENRL